MGDLVGNYDLVFWFLNYGQDLFEFFEVLQGSNASLGDGVYHTFFAHYSFLN